MTPRRRRLPLLVALLLLATAVVPGGHSAAGAASDPTVSGIFVTEDEEKVVAYADLQYLFTPTVKEALEGGLPITVKFRVEMYSVRSFWKDRLIGKATVTKVLRYDRVKELYLLKEQSAGGGAIESSASSAEAAKRWLSRLEKVPLAPLSAVTPRRRHYLRVRAEIELSQRGFPLNILLFFLPSDNAATDWTVSPLFSVSGSGKQ